MTKKKKTNGNEAKLTERLLIRLLLLGPLDVYFGFSSSSESRSERWAGRERSEEEEKKLQDLQPVVLRWPAEYQETLFFSSSSPGSYHP